jgi:hypothetical protein
MDRRRARQIAWSLTAAMLVIALLGAVWGEPLLRNVRLHWHRAYSPGLPALRAMGCTEARATDADLLPPDDPWAMPYLRGTHRQFVTCVLPPERPADCRAMAEAYARTFGVGSTGSVTQIVRPNGAIACTVWSMGDHSEDLPGDTRIP